MGSKRGIECEFTLMGEAMETRLMLCAQSLIQVERKLKELQASTTDVAATIRVAEALGLLYEARSAVSETENMLKSSNGPSTPDSTPSVVVYEQHSERP